MNRNVVERFFNRMKHRRAIASRYDKHATVYRGGIVLAAIVDWLKHIQDTAWPQVGPSSMILNCESLRVGR